MIAGVGSEPHQRMLSAFRGDGRRFRLRAPARPRRRVRAETNLGLRRAEFGPDAVCRPSDHEFLLEAEVRGVKTAPDILTPLWCSGRFLEAYRDRFALVRKCRPFVYFRRDLSMQSCTAMPCRSAPAPKNADALRATIETHRVADMELKRQTSFPDCAGCKHHIEGTCQGGCMTYKVYADTKSEL